MKDIITLEFMTIGPFLLLVFPGISQKYAIRIGHHSETPGHEDKIVSSWDHRAGTFHLSRPIPLTGERTFVVVAIYPRGKGALLHTAHFTYYSERSGGELAKGYESEYSFLSIESRRKENSSTCVQDSSSSSMTHS